MVISGNNSDLHIRNALELIKQTTMGKTHEIPKDSTSSSDDIHPPVEKHPDEVREDIHGVVFVSDER